MKKMSFKPKGKAGKGVFKKKFRKSMMSFTSAFKR